jgi:phosphoribosylformylglycinamidine cyclo-ligase
MSKKLSYADSGVDRESGDSVSASISAAAKRTHTKRVKYSRGGYAALYEVSPEHWVASTTDGVGTKLKLAFDSGLHGGVGIDLVAMCVNDLICAGATPTTFLDYFATGRLEPAAAKTVLEGIVRGCEQAGCALVGGETAEMPGMYSDGEYDLAGFAQGLLNPKNLLPKPLSAGMKVLGLASSGVHSNGYSLVRKLLEEIPEADRRKQDQVLIEPTRVYVKSVLPLLERQQVEALVHITGGGLNNLYRVLDEGQGLQLKMPSREELPPGIQWLIDRGRVEEKELYETFNMGVGMAVFVRPDLSDSVRTDLEAAGEMVFDLGVVTEGGSIRAQLASGAETEFKR